MHVTSCSDHFSIGSIMPPAISVTDTSVLLVPTDLADGKISSVRRTFGLFVLFDLILIFILWIIYTQLFGISVFSELEKQVKNYNFRTSLFDIVMLSASRFILLIIAYILLRINHWWMIAVCTIKTCAFLIVKIFFFEFVGASNPLSYCLVIISFVLAWLETWFLDFKVLPHEKKLKERVAPTRNRGYGSTFIEYRGVDFPAGEDIQSIITEDNNLYYSPLNSPEGSDTEQEDHSPNAKSSHQETDYIQVARHSWEVLKSYVNSPETDWKLESDNIESGGIVHSKQIRGLGKVFRLKSVIDMAFKELFEEMIFKVEKQPLWNLAIQKAKVLQVIDDHTDIIYSISAETAGGLITNRDFVSVHTWGSWDGIYMVSWMAVTHPSMPPHKNYVRGTNGPGGWVFKPLSGDNQRTLFFWYFNTDIKGTFPQKVIDTNMIKMAEEFSKKLQAHVRTIAHS